MKRRVKVYGGIVLGMVLGWAILNFFHAETLALGWHLQHGFHAEINGIKVPVPLLYEANDSDGITTLMLIKSSGRIQRGGGFITVNFLPRLSPEARQRIDGMLAKRGMTKTKLDERTLMFAGRSGTCIESIERFGESRPDELVKVDVVHDIDCWFGDVAVTLMGTANLKDDFYRIIQSAQQVRRKN